MLRLSGQFDLGTGQGTVRAALLTLALSLRYTTRSPSFSGILGTARVTKATVTPRATSVVGVGATG